MCHKIMYLAKSYLKYTENVLRYDFLILYHQGWEFLPCSEQLPAAMAAMQFLLKLLFQPRWILPASYSRSMRAILGHEAAPPRIVQSFRGLCFYSSFLSFI